MIETFDLSKSFGDNKVLEGVNLKVVSGDIFGLVGINGAGKSTLLRLLCGVLKPDAGKILIDGEEVYENPNAKKKLFFLPDDPYYTPNLTGNKQAEFYKNFYDFYKETFRRYIDVFLSTPTSRYATFPRA